MVTGSASTFASFIVRIGEANLFLSLVLIIPTWRICTRAGFSGALSLFHLVPVIGSFIVMGMLAVVPVGKLSKCFSKNCSGPPRVTSRKSSSPVALRL